MKSLILTTAAILAIAPAALAAPGGNGHGGGQGAIHSNGGGDFGSGRDRNGSPGSARVNGGWTVNNGVATNPGGHVMGRVPPGQARKMGGNLAVGGVLSSNYPGYRVVSGGRYNLPAAPAGYEYVRVGDDAYLRQSNTGVISSVMQNLFR